MKLYNPVICLLGALLLCALAVEQSETEKKRAKDSVTTIIFGLENFALNNAAEEIINETITKEASWNHNEIENIQKNILSFYKELITSQENTATSTTDLESTGSAHDQQPNCGKIGNQGIVARIHTAIDSHGYDHCLHNDLEKSIVKKVVTRIFDPRILARNTHLISAGTELINRCAKNNRVKLLALTNLTNDALDACKKYSTLKEFLNQFSPENIITAESAGCNKSDKKMFEYLVKTRGIQPESCLIIDSNTQTLETAKSLGFRTIIIENENSNTVQLRLKELNLIR